MSLPSRSQPSEMSSLGVNSSRLSATSTAPPQYSAVDTSASDAPSGGLPRYSALLSSEPACPNACDSGSNRVQHIFSVDGDTKPNPWATLKVFGGPTSVQVLGGENVTGSINLHLDRPQSIQSIHILLRGRISTGSWADSVYTFLEHLVPIWSKASGPPESAAGSPSNKNDGKLGGDVNFPFSIPFPSEIGRNDASVSSDLLSPPATFSERNSVVNIRYELVVRISRGKLRSMGRIKVPIAYTPNVAPTPLSFLRQIAYRNHQPVPGPRVDSAGWFTMPSVSVHGVMPQKRQVEVKCTLSLANPLSYTRGSVIPCSLVLQSLDTQTLDHLSKPKRLDLRLIRRVKYYQEPAVVMARKNHNQEPVVQQTEIATAVWWVPPKDGQQTSDERRLEGEIHLLASLQPSSDFVLFKAEYSVVLHPFVSREFVRADNESVVQQDVKIATRPCVDGLPLRAVTAPPRVKTPEPRPDQLGAPDTSKVNFDLPWRGRLG